LSISPLLQAQMSVELDSGECLVSSHLSDLFLELAIDTDVR
jgi:hypothetical protein